MLQAIKSNWLAPVGPDLASFESELATVTGSAQCVALSSGTAAIHLALLAAGVQPGDDVLCASLTFAGSAFPIAYVGANPVFIDSESTSWNIDPALAEDEIRRRTSAGKKPVALIAVDLYGTTADYAALQDICGRYGVALIEDAAESLGATHTRGPAGSLGDMGVLSFNGNKIITSSGGGALVCNDADVADRVRFLATQAREQVAHYEHAEVGFNYRMSNVLAALGSAQLATLDERVSRRRQIHATYADLVRDLDGVEMAPSPEWGTSNHWLSCITISDDASMTRSQIMSALEAENIETRVTWKPMHLQPVFAQAERRLNGVSDSAYRTGLCLPSGSGLSDQHLERIVATIRSLAGLVQ